MALSIAAIIVGAVVGVIIGRVSAGPPPKSHMEQLTEYEKGRRIKCACGAEFPPSYWHQCRGKQ